MGLNGDETLWIVLLLFCVIILLYQQQAGISCAEKLLVPCLCGDVTFLPRAANCCHPTRHISQEKTQFLLFGTSFVNFKLKNMVNKICEEIIAHWVGPLESLKILGIQFSIDLQSMDLLNYNKIMLSLRNLILSCSKRSLGVLGRITVVKSLLLSKLTFLILTIPDPPVSIVND